jgi:hypothetical protein
VRESLLPLIEQNDLVVLDFTGVNVVSNSFAGEHIKIHSPEFPDWNSVIRYIYEKESI